MIRPLHATLGVMSLVILTGCTTLPSFGPSSTAIDDAAVAVVSNPQDVLPFRIVDVSTSTLPVAVDDADRFPAGLREQALRTTDAQIDVGDHLDLRIWEVAENGLFATVGRRETTLPLVVAESGTINPPYAGTVTARGLTTANLRDVLLDRYRGQAIEPEIAVTVTQSQSRSIAVLGAVGSPGRMAIHAGGIRLLDLIAQAGGAADPAWETMITVRRDAIAATVSMSDILRIAENNIVALPGDVVSVAHVPRRFTVYGAVNQPGNVEIPSERATLAYLLAESGGLNDGVAQAKSVFVFRPKQPDIPVGSLRATAYRFDFSEPDAFLLASMFALSPTDIVYVTSAQAVNFQRFASLILSPVLGTATLTGN
jgi:polysaccharide export outer membrane protein